jgi:hypothetical protein
VAHCAECTLGNSRAVPMGEEPQARKLKKKKMKKMMMMMMMKRKKWKKKRKKDVRQHQ